MRAVEILTEKELNEYKMIDRALHYKTIRVAFEYYKKLLKRGMNPHDAFVSASHETQVRPRELQSYLKDHGYGT